MVVTCVYVTKSLRVPKSLIVFSIRNSLEHSHLQKQEMSFSKTQQPAEETAFSGTVPGNFKSCVVFSNTIPVPWGRGAFPKLYPWTNQGQFSLPGAHLQHRKTVTCKKCSWLKGRSAKLLADCVNPDFSRSENGTCPNLLASILCSFGITNRILPAK